MWKRNPRLRRRRPNARGQRRSRQNGASFDAYDRSRPPERARRRHARRFTSKRRDVSSRPSRRRARLRRRARPRRRGPRRLRSRRSSHRRRRGRRRLARALARRARIFGPRALFNERIHPKNP